MENNRPLILLTNDDGIQSPGIWAAAGALMALGDVWVIAPRDQSTSAGRSHPIQSDGVISRISKTVLGKEMKGYALGASPAQVVHYAILDILPKLPDLVVSGINYGCNTGPDITRSGTIGAALEGANYKVRSIAVSLETTAEMAYSHSTDVDFSVAAYFTAFFAQRLLTLDPEADMDVLKVEVPSDATKDTGWEVTRLAPTSLYLPDIQKSDDKGKPAKLNWRIQDDYSVFPEGSDSHTVFVKRRVAVTPLSLDLTSRINLSHLETRLHKNPIK